MGKYSGKMTSNDKITNIQCDFICNNCYTLKQKIHSFSANLHKTVD